MTQAIDEQPLHQAIEDAVNGGQPLIWVKTREPAEALKTLCTLTAEFEGEWRLRIWGAASGIEVRRGSQIETGKSKDRPPSCLAFTSALRDMAFDRRANQEAQANELDEVPPEDEIQEIFVVQNAHLEVGGHYGSPDKMLLNTVQDIVQVGKIVNCHLVMLSFPEIKIPEELAAQVWVVNHELPDEDERFELVDALIEASYEDEEEEEPPTEDEIRESARVCSGLTRTQTESCCAMSLVQRQNRLDPVLIHGLKAKTINSGGVLTVHKGTQGFDTVGGLAGLKKFLKRSLSGELDPKVRGKGVLLLGVPGTGKSAIAKALGVEMDRQTLLMDVGNLMGGIVGETESRTREALAIADAMEPCQLFVDEIEKALGGGGERDGGVNSRLKGTFLTWLNDHTTDVFTICTANDIRAMPPEMFRAGRFDAIFFMDLPSRESKNQIWDLYRGIYGIEDETLPDDKIWTGGEIEACCRLSVQQGLDLREASKLVVPVFLTAGEQINSLREWARHRCLDAETGGIYTPDNRVEVPDEPVAHEAVKAPSRKVRVSGSKRAKTGRRRKSADPEE